MQFSISYSRTSDQICTDKVEKKDYWIDFLSNPCFVIGWSFQLISPTNHRWGLGRLFQLAWGAKLDSALLHKGMREQEGQETRSHHFRVASWCYKLCPMCDFGILKNCKTISFSWYSLASPELHLLMYFKSAPSGLFIVIMQFLCNILKTCVVFWDIISAKVLKKFAIKLLGL